MEMKDRVSVLGPSLSILGPTTPSPRILRIAFALFPSAWNIPHWFMFLEFAQSIVARRGKVKPHNLKFRNSIICHECRFS